MSDLFANIGMHVPSSFEEDNRLISEYLNADTTNVLYVNIGAVILDEIAGTVSGCCIMDKNNNIKCLSLENMVRYNNRIIDRNNKESRSDFHKTINKYK